MSAPDDIIHQPVRLRIMAALTALQDREAVVRECAAVCDQVNVEYEEHPEMALTCRSAILKLLEPK